MKLQLQIIYNLQYSYGDYKDKLYNSIKEDTGATNTIRDTQSFHITHK